MTFGAITNTIFEVKLLWILFEATLEKIGLFFILKSGHTGLLPTIEPIPTCWSPSYKWTYPIPTCLDSFLQMNLSYTYVLDSYLQMNLSLPTYRTPTYKWSCLYLQMNLSLRTNEPISTYKWSYLYLLIGENKIVDLEEELRQIGENLKALEVAEEKAQQREEEFKKQIKVLSDRLKLAETRFVGAYFF